MIQAGATMSAVPHNKRKRLQSILIKPAGPDCNMNCNYCFYLDKAALFPQAKIHRMSEEILEETIRQCLWAEPDQLSLGWQGGEPTLMGLHFFEKAVEFEQRYGRNQIIGNGLQTNGLLINRDWAKFLAKYKFLVGLSLDGPQHIHDRYRILKNGKGTWSEVADKAKLLLDAGVAVNAISVVTDYSVQFAEEIYDYHKQLGLSYMQFIPCFERNPAIPSEPAPFSVPAEGYGKFLCRLFDLWTSNFVQSTPTTSIRFFDSIFYSYIGLEPPECTLGRTCGLYLVVEHNGDIYSCDFFVTPEWRLGNILEGNLLYMLNSKRQQEFGMRKARLPGECLKCAWLTVCRGGCPKDKVSDGENGFINHFCPSFKMFFEHAGAKFRHLAQEWKERQPKQMKVDRPVSPQKPGRNDPCPCGSGLKYKKCCGKT